MNTSSYFQVNSPNVIHEIIDGEAVLISMETGSYYSIDDVGAVIWSHIENGLSVSHIIEKISSQYAGDQNSIARGVNQLISQLQEELLIVAAEPTENSTEIATFNSNKEPKPQFETPILNKYTDMEDLLLLDPIHEVDETGWPHLPGKA